jgi:hypothetical protein
VLILKVRTKKNIKKVVIMKRITFEQAIEAYRKKEKLYAHDSLGIMPIVLVDDVPPMYVNGTHVRGLPHIVISNILLCNLEDVVYFLPEDDEVILYDEFVEYDESPTVTKEYPTLF